MSVTDIRSRDRKVPTRRISFEEALAQVPRHFAADEDLVQSHLAAALSSLFPDGEDFFVRSVRHYRDRITEPELKRQTAGFIGQESVHGREHRAFNDRLAELGYPAKGIERMTYRLFQIHDRFFSAKSNLALTAALEHFTATLAELVLTSRQTRDLFGDEHVRDLFTWHALEESEHKAVAFDVYRAIGGSEGLRIRTMRILRYSFVAVITVLVLISLAGDPDTYKPRTLWRSWRRLARSPLMSMDVWRQLGEYNRRGFHPDDRDTNPLVEQWRIELFGDDGRLNPLLAGAAQ